MLHAMAGTCTTCEMGLDHCHGLVVEHHAGDYECTDGCGGGLLVHDDVITCVELGLGCCPADVLEDPERTLSPLAPAA
jgi:hypothetical protein